jgi:hypothetical protein
MRSNDAFRDPGVRAIVTTLGGAGASRIADGIDFAAVRADPKPLVGFSDITNLHLALWEGACGLFTLFEGGATGRGGISFGSAAHKDAAVGSAGEGWSTVRRLIASSVLTRRTTDPYPRPRSAICSEGSNRVP